MDVSVDGFEVRIQELFAQFVYDKCVPTLKGTCPSDTGALRASIHAEKMSDRQYFVGTDMPYAKFADQGRKEVRPVVKQALWWSELDHPVMYAKEYGGSHFVEDAVAKLK